MFQQSVLKQAFKQVFCFGLGRRDFGGGLMGFFLFFVGGFLGFFKSCQFCSWKQKASYGLSGV